MYGMYRFKERSISSKKLKNKIQEKTSSKMSSQVFSREYLQGLPEQRKQQIIRNVIPSFIQQVQQAAATGITFSIFDPSAVEHMHLRASPLPITTEDYIIVFQSIFPGCVIEYRETWVETSATSRVLKKGIVVDWS